jgi:HEAT repeat protein
LAWWRIQFNFQGAFHGYAPEGGSGASKAISMIRTFAVFLLTFLLSAAELADKYEGRKPNPFAPSLPELTDEEDEAIDRVIDRFILFDTGRLTGAEGKKALADFQDLGPEAIPVLIRGLNRAAKLEASCPALTIAKKLSGMLRTSNDVKLLEFARENIGAGVGKTRHGGLLNDLRVGCMLRKRVAAAHTALAAREKSKEQKTLRSMSVSELATAVTTEKGARLKVLLTELGGRKGSEAVAALGSAAASGDKETVALARRLLAANLARLAAKPLREVLKDERIEVRMAAARAAATKGLALADNLIELLGDTSVAVRRSAHQALVKVGKGTDQGPGDDPSDDDWAQAAKAWRAWLIQQKTR